MSLPEALVNPDAITTASGVEVSNTCVVLGSDRVIFNVINTTPPTYSASTNMQIYVNHAAAAQTSNLVPIEQRFVTYPVPDASAVYSLLYYSAQQTEGWANATIVSGNSAPSSNASQSS